MNSIKVIGIDLAKSVFQVRVFPYNHLANNDPPIPATSQPAAEPQQKSYHSQNGGNHPAALLPH